MINTVEKIYFDSVFQNTYKVTLTDNTAMFVPHDTANRHYQEILEWVAKGNTITDNGGGE
tara:strand:+ start:387 stop:566 length:180 start_codon:yes stop_codon:yes gene_type:complete